jgi:NTP pyrophosphatase (non-canonical NTP hydrolase)
LPTSLLSPSEYQKQASEFVSFPSRNWQEYLPLALMGEIGELFNVFKKQIRNQKLYKEKIMDESGDILWYMAILCKELNIDFQTPFNIAAEMPHRSMDEGESRRVMMYSAVTIDSRMNGPISAQDHMEWFVAPVLYHLLRLLALYELDINEVMGHNIKKLTERRDNDQIKEHA